MKDYLIQIDGELGTVHLNTPEQVTEWLSARRDPSDFVVVTREFSYEWGMDEVAKVSGDQWLSDG